jgi:hypothetical protein
MDMHINKTAAFILPATCMLLWWSGKGYSQPVDHQAQPFEEIVVDLEVPKLVSEDIFVLYDGRTVYLPLTRVLNLLGMNVTADLEKKKFSGFVFTEDDKYELDFSNYRIKSLGQEFPYIASDYSLAANEVYVKVDVFGDLFGLKIKFDFAKLRVSLPLDKSFPAYKRLQRKRAREKLDKEEELLKDVVRVPHHRDYFSGAAVDWVLSTSPLGGRDQHYYHLNTGGMALGGDFSVVTGGSTSEPFDSDQLTYRWHYYVDDNAYLTQAELGQTNVGGPLSRGLNGVLLTNRPQARRKFFQTINVTDHVGEGWEVELYVDNRLVDYVVTDHTGIYDFSLDLLYGASTIGLRMYGPNGEIRTEEKNIRVPYNLIPKNKVEYSVGTGRAKSNHVRRTYLQANAYYGILTNLTAGVNLDAPLDSDDGEERLLALDVTYQALGNLTVNSSFAPDYVATARLSFAQPSLISVAAHYSRYFENPFRNPLDQESGLSLSVTAPIRIGRRYLGLRYHVTIDRYPFLVATNMDYGFNFTLHPFHLNYIGRYKNSDFAVKNTRNISSRVLFSSQFPRFVRPQFRIDYDHTNSEIVKYGVYLMKRVLRTGQVALSYERNLVAGSDMVMLTFNFYSSFANFASRLLRTGGQVSMNQVQRGSVRYNRENRSVQFDRRNSVGFGSAIVKPFHDNNYNGVMDIGEEYVPGLRAKIKSTRTRISKKEDQYYYEGLRPYERYNVQIDKYSLDDPMLRPSYENYEVTVSPNVTTSIEVPIVTASDLVGRVERQVTRGKSGAGGIKLILVNLSKESVVEVSSFNNGDIYYFGLLPGSYRAYLDPSQLAQSGYVSQPESINFEINPVRDGTTVENINFLLVPKETVPASE